MKKLVLLASLLTLTGTAMAAPRLEPSHDAPRPEVQHQQNDMRNAPRAENKEFRKSNNDRRNDRVKKPRAEKRNDRASAPSRRPNNFNH